MEPSSVEDGKCVGSDIDSQRAKLQWSRPQLRTETLANPLNPLVKEMLQWSRPQLRTETSQQAAAAMEIFGASMEPSSVEDGNLAPVSLPELRQRGFNGAVLS